MHLGYEIQRSTVPVERRGGAAVQLQGVVDWAPLHPTLGYTLNG